MSSKFLGRDAIIDTIKSEQRANAIRKRLGQTKHPICEAIPCGCPDPGCGAFHLIRTMRTIPTTDECKVILATDKKSRKTAARIQRQYKKRLKSQGRRQTPDTGL
jgi:hypothetical protein